MGDGAIIIENLASSYDNIVLGNRSVDGATRGLLPGVRTSVPSS